ncbi:MAG: sulfide/dihydroorotate dehydrogenase-like FAD/NAD-binding protein [Oscillospiraceae bacterium]|jgi:ferredoxin--NADP+ reductase|nr:sulfide/dihydroorotate dehydrogenase-like FAD/NAD-binding protein [Oscillospiraceae bacterium]
MYEILKKEFLNPAIILMDIYAPDVAKRAKPGQFVILRADENGERVPFTIGGYEPERGSVTIMFQIAGATSEQLAHMNQGDALHDFTGPLGRPTELAGLKKAAVIGGGVGCAIAYPIAKALHEQGTETHVIIGFRDKSRVLLADEFRAASDKIDMLSNDGSYGAKGFVSDALQAALEGGEQYDEVIAIGPLMMMKVISDMTRGYGIRTTVSMNPIMIDGTGMCGCCRLTVGGEMKFACVDGPDFDGHAVDFDEAISRLTIYNEFERAAHDHVCNLYKTEAND